MLKINQLEFMYPNIEKKVLADISLSVKQGSFTVLCGPTGSGKSTLLRLIKQELAPLGEKRGEILFQGKKLESLTPKEAAAGIGFVGQSPEQQLVTDRVWHELAFGLENLGYPDKVIRRRVQEIANFFGINEWFEKPVYELSGGQKQLLNLAAVMVMQPELLILDEPTAQLDPIAASEYIQTLQKLNEELGLTILISEHRLEELIPVCSQLILLEQGRIIIDESPRLAAGKTSKYPAFRHMMPTAVRLYHALQEKNDSSQTDKTILLNRECPLTVREGRELLGLLAQQEKKTGTPTKTLAQLENETGTPPKSKEMNREREREVALQIKNARFRYDRESPYVLNDLNLEVKEGEILCILGANGSGKSTMLGAVAGWNKLESGEIRIFGIKMKEYKNQSLYQNCLALLPQEVQTLFLHPTVGDELQEMLGTAQEGKSLQEMMAAQYGDLFAVLENLLNKHPYDCSGGEQQLLALAKVMATNPRLLLMDEPTKGLDADTKQGLQRVLMELKQRGVTLIIVTHDIEFAALCADRCALFFCGDIDVIEDTRVFFSGNYFYTTAANRMAREYYPGVVTLDELVQNYGSCT